MPSDEARALAAMVLAHYPGEFINEMNVLALADTFERMGMDIAPEVAERARGDLFKPPSSAHLFAIAREVRDEVARLEEAVRRPALSEGTGIEMPDEVREHIAEMVNPDRKRKERETEIADQDANWQRKKAAASAARRMTSVCGGTGKVPIQAGEQWVCPDCGVVIPEMEFEPIPKPIRRTSWKTGDKA